MTSQISDDFRRDFAALPEPVQRQARTAYRIFQQNPNHPSLRFKKLAGHNDLWSVRINNQYRAIGRWRDDVILWFFIGSHSDYDRLLGRI